MSPGAPAGRLADDAESDTGNETDWSGKAGAAPVTDEGGPDTGGAAFATDAGGASAVTVDDASHWLPRDAT